MSIPQSFIQDLLSRVDLVELIGRSVTLKKAGANYAGLCPFHAEKSPSFTVSPSKQFYHCFGCGKNGNAIGFLMEHAGLGFVEAVQDLAQSVGLAVPEDTSAADPARSAAQRQRQASLTDVLEQAARAYQQALRQAPVAQDYFKGRGITGQTAKRFGLGWAPPGWKFLASVFARYDDPLLTEAGLVITQTEGDVTNRWDRFRERVMFPIRNVKGDCIGLGGRVLGDDKPKYLNSPETPVFNKGHELYGLFEARSAIRERGYVIVTEGYMDVVALAQNGFANTVATLGTACTADHVRKLFRFSDAVVFSFDGDAAGRRAARKALEAALPFASDTRSVRFLFLPPEHDPDSYIRALGQAAFSRCIDDAVPLSRFLPEVAREGCDLSVAEGRAQMLAHARPLWQAMPPGILKQQVLETLAEAGHMPSAQLQAAWRSQVGSRQTGAVPSDGQAPLSRQGQPWRPQRASASTPGRTVATRADHVARLLLLDMAAMDGLTSEDLQLLANQADPHGALFRWLESQLHELGPLPWAALREGLPPECADLAHKLITPMHLIAPEATDDTSTDLRWELRDLLNRLLIDHIKALESAAIARANTDPRALEEYRRLVARRRSLEMPANGATAT